MVEKEEYDLLGTYGIPILPMRYEAVESVYYARLAKLLKIHIPSPDIEQAMQRSKAGPFFLANGEVHFN